MDAQLYRKLNALDFTSPNYQRIVHYKNTGNFPANLTTQIKRTRFANSFDPFFVEDGRLKYTYQHAPNESITLTVLKENEIEDKLREIYDDNSLGLGHGQRQFYQIVSSKYLGVSRKETTAFLKRQIGHQLSRKNVSVKHPTKKYYEKNQAWALDLIDMSNIANFNQNWKYIFSVKDLYTSECRLRKLHSKTPNAVLNAWNTFSNNEFKPKLLLFDNGTEFKAQFSEMLRNRGIKSLNTKSHTPQPEIENLNAQIRKLIAEINIKNKNLIWHTHLLDIQQNINNFNKLPRNRWKRGKKRDDAENHENPPAIAKFQVGDRVRVRQSAFLSKVREKNKAGNQKEMPVKLSVIWYVIHRIYAPPRNQTSGFYHYSLKYQNGNIVTENGVHKRYRESDLMRIPLNLRGDELTVQESHQLNRI